MPVAKPWWKSKTLWVNLVGLVIVVVETLTQQDVITLQVSAAIIGVANIILRLITSQPIGGTTPTNPNI